MATKPVIAVTVRASQALYTTGDPALIGLATKISRSGADLIEGHKVDTAGTPAPVFAQEINFEDNRNDQYIDWVRLGSDAAGGDAHIVETDSSGDINVLGVNCIDVRVTPNTGTDGIEVTTSGGSKGVEVLQDATSTDYGVAVTSTDGATAPAFFAQTVSNVGMIISTGDKPAINLGATANGGVVGPLIKMAPTTIDPTDDNVGTFWARTENSIDNVKMGMGSSAGYPVIAKNAPCYARSNSVSFALNGVQTNQVIISSFGWEADMVPQNAAEVMVNIRGKIQLQSTQDNQVTLKVRDITAASAVICEIPIFTVEHSGASLFTIRQSAAMSETYTLLASGARTFELVWTGVTTGVDGLFEGFVEIENLRG